MITQIIHADGNYIRRFNSDSTQVISDGNWGLDTTGNTDLNGEILIETVNDIKTLADGASQEQIDAGQIRFNSDVLDYKIKAIIRNVVLKYDSALIDYDFNYLNDNPLYPKVVTVLVDEDDVTKYSYQIPFNFMFVDPLGIDGSCLEAYVNNLPFFKALRDSPFDTEVHVTEYNNPTEYGFHSDQVIGIFHDVTDMANVDLVYDCTKINDILTAKSYYNYKLTLSGHNYFDDDINSTDEEITNFETALTNGIEADIIDAWNNASGIKFKFFDIAGNITYYVMPKIHITTVTIDTIKNINKLLISFKDIYPEDLDLSNGKIGKATIVAKNLNKDLLNGVIRIGLLPDSRGSLLDFSYNSYLENENGFLNYATIDVDNVVDAGYVKAYAYIDLNLKGELSYINDLVYRLTYNTGDLGAFITECLDNKRKINIKTFLPSYLEDSEFANFVDLTEKYLNQMFSPIDSYCSISVLEKVSRISNFNNIDKIEKPLFDKYAYENGNNLDLTFSTVNKLLSVQKTIMINETETDVIQEYDPENVMRTVLSMTSVINGIKGTNTVIPLILNIFGIQSKLSEDQNNKLKISIINISDDDLDLIKPELVKLLNKVTPINKNFKEEDIQKYA